MYYPCSKTKGADQMRGYVYAFDFAYAKNNSFHEAAHLNLDMLCILNVIHVNACKTVLRTFASKCSYVDITLRLCTYFISCKNLSLKE